MSKRYLFFISFVAILAAINAEVVLKDNGYEGVVVAIHNSIDEDLALLQNIKELFRSASKFLYEATQQRAFFRSVTIALPSHWSDQDEYVRSTGNHFPGANVRVDAPNPQYGDDPYTLQPGECGEPGRYIHLTANYVLSLYKNKKDEQPGKRFVHEWAHLRYGVFDENGDPNDPKYPVFYKDGKVYANACVRSIRGTMVQSDGSPCDITEGSDVNLRGCSFIPFDDNEVKASLMFKPYVPSITNFCDDDSHNRAAPNKHNEMCKSESVWAVMKRHRDFRSSRRVALKEEELEPQFRIVKAKQDDRGRYVLVLDVSGSMRGKPLQLLNDSATRLITDVIKEGSLLGLVSFRDLASELSPLVQVTNLTRELLVSKLPTIADGKTAIGEGLKLGAKILEGNDSVTDGAVIVLLTDGEENVPPYIEEVTAVIQKKKIIVHCIAFGSAASEKLEKLAQSTGGKSFLVQDISGNKPVMVLDSAFREAILTTMEEEKQPVLVMQDDVELYLPQTELGVDLDPQLGRNTIFSLDAGRLKRNSVNMTVLSPNGELYGPESGNEVYSTDREHIRVTLPTETDSGNYNVKLTKKRREDISASLSVTSEPRDPDDQPIRVKSWLSGIQVKYPGRIRVFAEVKRGYDPVLEASVTTTVRQSSSLQEVILRDNGIGPDVTADDGIYSAYITQFNSNGRYGVVSKVINTGSARLKFSSNSGNGIRNTDDKARVAAELKEWGNNGSEPPILPAFQRTAEAGTFLVESWNPNVPNVFPPDRVRDLQVIGKRIDSSQHKFVTLAWTCPGEEMDQSKDIWVDLRASCSLGGIINQFEEAFVFKPTWILNGSLLASSPQEKQTLTVKISEALVNDPNCTFDSTESFYFALRLYEDLTTPGDISVVAAAHFEPTPVHQPQVEQTWIPWLIGGAVVLLLLCLAVIIYRKR